MIERDGGKNDCDLLPSPRVTLGLLTYRQELFVQHALRSALAQTYASLEIVVCDDASPDRTFELACAQARSYEGSHTLKLHRNERNLGIGNFNRLMELATGDLIVIAHGDDISMPERVARLVAAWRKTGASMVTSNAIVIDEQGHKLGYTLAPGATPANRLVDIAERGWNQSLWGAALAWHREVFDIFGPLDVDRSAVTSDWILPFRAAAIRGIHYVDAPLVLIRQHPNQKQRRYITDLTNPLSNVESISASDLIQFLYMIDTMDTVKAKKLQAPDVVTAVDSSLLRSVLHRGFEWRTARNRLFASGVRARWLPLE
jgi:glycosyltransferase involved in cell wall biosynthesis